MKHELRLTGDAFRLRPVQIDDADFILSLRCDPALNMFLNATDSNIETQREWLRRYEARNGDYYFVVEGLRDQTAEGLISIYDVADGAAEWGRWLLQPKSLAAAESAALIYRCAFDLLDLDRVYCRTVAANERTVSFHDSSGVSHKRLLPRHFELRGRCWDAVEHTLKRTEWPAVDANLTRLAKLTAKRIAGES